MDAHEAPNPRPSAGDGSPAARPDTGHEAAWARLLGEVAAAPWRFDFFVLLRRVEALHPRLPRLGRALRPAQEPLRVGQDPELDFAPAPLSSLSAREGAAPRLGQRFFGLLGPMGPLPLHLTEQVRERARSLGDATALAFLDLFQHRAALLLYRARAEAQPVCHLDRPEDDGYGRWLASFAGLAGAAMARRDALPDAAKRFHVGALARGPRSAEGLARILAQYFAVPVRVEPLVGHWLELAPDERLALRRPPPRLGVDAAAGTRVWDRQSRFRLHLGPLSLARYEAFLPGAPAWRALRDWLQLYLGQALSCELRLVLAGAEVPPPVLGRPRAGRPAARLGRSSWLGARPGAAGAAPPDRGDYRQRMDPAAGRLQGRGTPDGARGPWTDEVTP